jgi:hypothetical protein
MTKCIKGDIQVFICLNNNNFDGFQKKGATGLLQKQGPPMIRNRKARCFELASYKKKERRKEERERTVTATDFAMITSIEIWLRSIFWLTHE